MDSPYRNIDEFISAFATTMDLLPTPWGFKNDASQHLYMNEAARAYTATPKNYLLEGKKDNEFPTRWSDCADEFCQHDLQVKENHSSVAVIETHYWYGNNYLSPFISEKYPVFDNKKPVAWLHLECTSGRQPFSNEFYRPSEIFCTHYATEARTVYPC